jgi:hypothetical protein
VNASPSPHTAYPRCRQGKGDLCRMQEERPSTQLEMPMTPLRNPNKEERTSGSLSGGELLTYATVILSSTFWSCVYYKYCFYKHCFYKHCYKYCYTVYLLLCSVIIVAI